MHKYWQQLGGKRAARTNTIGNNLAAKELLHQ
jgi:hypothetical protein